MAMFYKLGSADDGWERLKQHLESTPRPRWQPYPTAPASYTVLRTPGDLDSVGDQENMLSCCSTCFDVSRDIRAFAVLEDTNAVKDNYFIQWKVSLADLAISADLGCHFCGLMACKFFQGSHSHILVMSTSAANNPLACCGEAHNTEASTELKDAIQNLRNFCSKYIDPEFTLISQPEDLNPLTKKFGKLRFLVVATNVSPEGIKEILCCRRDYVIEVYTPTENSPAARHFEYIPPNTDAGSEDSINTVANWLRVCQESHEECKTTGKLGTPKRLIKIIDESNLVLCCDPEHAPYVALSYCWGGPQLMSLNKSNIAALQNGFLVSALPGALKDAVRITLKLNLRHIWIDSLCIIQDHASDKEAEIPKMPMYYQSASLTVSSGRGSCDKPFLEVYDRCEKHKANVLPRDMLTMPILTLEGQTCAMFFRDERPYCMSWAPVSKRAWTFQERLLSARMVLFATSRTVWHCNRWFVSDGGTEDWNVDPRTAAFRELQMNFVRYRKSMLTCISNPASSECPENSESRHDLYGLWYQALAEYTRRNLSLSEDKLPAISGFATELYKLHYPAENEQKRSPSSGEYVAGLWRDDLIRGLLWTTWPNLQLKKPDNWRAPSWSWASVDNAVSYKLLEAVPRDAQALAEIIECTTAPKVPGFAFGQIDSATLCLRAPLLTLEKSLSEKILRRQYMMPPLKHSLRFDPDLFDKLEILQESGESEEKWKAPEKMSFLILLAHQVAVPAADARPIANTASLVSSDTQTSSSNSPNNPPSVDKTDSDRNLPQNFEPVYHGIFVASKADGTYERVAAYVWLQLTGDLDVSRLVKTISLV